MRRSSVSPAPVVAVVAALALLVACTGEPGPTLETAEVGPGEVVQTIATAARIEPIGRVTVAAPTAGEVEALFVGDGDVVSRGERLLRLDDEALAAQIAQAEAALETTAQLPGLAAAGIDLAPVLGALAGTFDSALPALLGALGAQVDVTEAAVVGVVRTAADAADGQAAAVEALADAIAEAVAQLPVDEELDLDTDLEPGLLDELDLGADPEQVAAAIAAAETAARDARAQLGAAQSALGGIAGELSQAQAEAAATAAAAEQAQLAAIEAQREQAEQALEAIRDQLDDLTLLAPVAGVVELVRDEGGAPAGLPGGVPDLGSLGDVGGLGGIGELLGGAGAGSSGVSASGPVTVGSEVGPGQALLRIYDLSRFTAELDVDELDIVEVEVGQSVVVLVDAFPGVELDGVVDRVAIAPDRSPTGGATYPVSVRLTEVPDEVGLRVGLTAAAEVEVRRVEAELVVPTSALLRRGGQEVVFAVREGRAVEVPVQVLAIGDDTAALEGDLASGEQVVTIGVELVEDGDEVPG